ncbi:MAG: hypothetical protein WD468_08455 [Pirellulales bacterium]
MPRVIATTTWFLLLYLACGVFQAHAQSQHVQPIQWSKYDGFGGVQPDDAFGQKLVGLIQKQSKFVMQEVQDPANYREYDDYPENPGVPYYYAFEAGRGYEASVRPLSNFALGTAVMLKTEIYDPTAAGVSQDEALRRATLAINGAALSHRANRLSGLRWGGGGQGSRTSDRWQAAYWAAQTGWAAWMLWDQLPADSQRVVGNMVEYEANSFLNYNVPYWRNPDGSTNYSGDTKSEENSWNAMILSVAQAMMPGHPNAGQWREKASELQVSAYSVQGDNLPSGSGSQVVDGKPVHEWLSGYNMFSDGVLVNHRLVQPDYMIGASTLHFSTAIQASLAGQQIPNSTFFNAAIVYQALTEHNFIAGQSASPYSSGTFNDPGGTIFRRTGSGAEAIYSAQVYYPQGEDWVQTEAQIILEGHLNFDLYAEMLGLDAGKDYDAMGWADARADRLLEMQARSAGAGNIYQPGDWVVDYFSQEQSIFMSITEAWLQHWLIRNGRMSPIGENWGPLQDSDAVGDFNRDGSVDAADYVLWRAGLGTSHTPAGYGIWRSNFGTQSSGGAVFAVPEPTSLTFLGLLMPVFARDFRRIER